MTKILHIPSGAQDLAPGDPLHTDPSRDELIRVTDGIVYVRLGDDDAVLVAGDSITVAAGEPRRAWNAGDETARVEVSGLAVRLAA
jgi:quercetin dioxygenase-like cupin family protein